MNLERIEAAVKVLRKHQKALAWLKEYGTQLTGKTDADEGHFELTLTFAGSCPGREEAAQIIEAYARLSLPELVATAIQSCENTIGMERSMIASELESD